MNQMLTRQFGNSKKRLQQAISALQRGEGIILVDDEDRENEGDIIYAAETLTVRQMNSLIQHCSGIVCLCLTQEKIQQLQLPKMVEDNNSRYGTAFTVSIEAKRGVTTGVSAQDRLTTVKAAIAEQAVADDLAKPGHIFPICAEPDGVLSRRGHTEGTIDIMSIAGLPPSGVLCELTNKDGSMATLPEIMKFATKHDMMVLTIEDIVQFRSSQTGLDEYLQADLAVVC